MQFNDYQEKSMSFRLPSASKYYSIIGLSGEVGELHSMLAKNIRDGSEIYVDGLRKELGDILWFISAIATDYGLTLDEVANANNEKLKRRQINGTIKGSGDNR